MLGTRESIIAVCYIVASVLLILGLKRLSSPATARSGNSLAAVGVFLALAATLLDREIVSYWEIGVGVAIGGLSALVAGGYGFAALRRNGSTWSHDTRVVTSNEPPVAAIAEDLVDEADAEATGQVVVV